MATILDQVAAMTVSPAFENNQHELTVSQYVSSCFPTYLPIVIIEGQSEGCSNHNPSCSAIFGKLRSKGHSITSVFANKILRVSSSAAPPADVVVV